jgi:formylglycine-generating enzyme required for sulfatase activity
MINTRLKAALEVTHLEHLLQSFTDEGVADEILCELTDADLEKLGIRKLGDRKRLLLAFQKAPKMANGATIMIEVKGGTLPEYSELKGTVVKTFEIGRHPVMHEEWEWVRAWGVYNGYELGEGHRNGDFRPITKVSWYDAVKWCNAKSEHEAMEPVYQIDNSVFRKGDYGASGSKWIKRNEKANGYRLPLEAEWEWAAIGGVMAIQPITKQAIIDKPNEPDDQPLGKETSSSYFNELGIYEITSNMWEWCWDRDETGTAHRIRSESASNLKSRQETRHRRISRSPDTRYSVIGFRLARNV